MKAKTLSIVFCLACALLIRQVACGEIVVAPNGDDSAAGTRSAPLKTIAAALAKLAPGDKAIVLAGTYKETITLPRSGEEGKPITLIGEGKVVLTPSDGHGIVGRGVGYWVVEGFEAEHAVQGIKFKDCHDITIRKCKAHACGVGLAFENKSAERMLFEDVELADSEAGGMDANNPCAMDHVTFRRCVAHHNACKGGTDGFGISHHCTAKEVRFENCQAYENGSDGFDLSGTGSGITVINCSAHGNGTKMWGANFKIWNPGTKVINCVAWHTSAPNHDGNFEAHGDDVSFINCTSGENEDSGFALSGKNTRLINCIIADAKKKSAKFYKDEKHPDPTATAENCLVFNCGDNGPVAVGSNGNISGDPQFVDAKAGDFKIKSGSAAMGKGKAVPEAAQDAAGKTREKNPSIGAYEP
jgi:parallel beta-helix repeat protein